MVPRVGQQVERAAKLLALSLAIASDRCLGCDNDRRLKIVGVEHGVYRIARVSSST